VAAEETTVEAGVAEVAAAAETAKPNLLKRRRINQAALR